MFSPEHLNSLIKDLMARLNEQGGDSSKNELQRCDNGNQVNSGCNVQSTGNTQSGCSTQTSGNGQNVCGGQNTGNKNKTKLTPAEALVIAGILGGTLDVLSVLVDKNQVIQIVLEGSLKKEVQKPKTELDMMLDKIGNMPFDQVLKAMLERLA